MNIRKDSDIFGNKTLQPNVVLGNSLFLETFERVCSNRSIIFYEICHGANEWRLLNKYWKMDENIDNVKIWLINIKVRLYRGA